MLHRILYALSLMVLSTSFCYSQEKPLTAVYELSFDPPNWIQSRNITYIVKKKEDGRIEYSLQHTGLSNLIFDPKTFSTETVKDGFVFEQSHNKTKTTFNLGDEWKLKYNIPPSQNCNENGKSEYNAEVTEAENITIKVGSSDTQVDKTTVFLRGFWYHCQYSGSGTRKTSYSTKLGLLLSSEQITYLSGTILRGARIVLKEIKND